MIKNNFRLGYFFLLLTSVVVFFASLYFQYVKNLQPCPLCLMQRLCVFILMVLALLGILLKGERSNRWVLIAQLLIAGAGVYFASRQLWLQSLPADQLPACLPGLDVMIRYFPLQDILRALVWGAADCSEITWQWLGLSMATYALIYFVVMLAASSVMYYRLRFFGSKK